VGDSGAQRDTGGERVRQTVRLSPEFVIPAQAGIQFWFLWLVSEGFRWNDEP